MWAYVLPAAEQSPRAAVIAVGPLRGYSDGIMQDLEEAVVRLVHAPGYRPVKPRVIAQQLKLSKEETVEVRRAIKRLVQAGRLCYGSNHLVMPVTAAKGKRGQSPTNLRSVPAADAGQSPFSRQGPEEQPPDGRVSAGTERLRLRPARNGGEGRGDDAKDIYIPADRTGDAATGDVVLVRAAAAAAAASPARAAKSSKSSSGRRSSSSARISSRPARPTCRSTARCSPSRSTSAIRARRTPRPTTRWSIEMVRFPSPLHDGEGVIVEVLGPRGKPGVDTLSIIREFNLPDAFAEDALDEARAAGRDVRRIDRRAGTDFTGETIVTIDPVDARDFDDAISLERLDDGHWRLGVHIADVSHFVRPEDGAGPRGPASGPPASICPTACCPCCRR